MSASTGRPVGTRFRNTDIRQPKPSPQVQDRRPDKVAPDERGKRGPRPTGLDVYMNNKVGQMKPNDRPRPPKPPARMGYTANGNWVDNKSGKVVARAKSEDSPRQRFPKGK